MGKRRENIFPNQSENSASFVTPVGRYTRFVSLGRSFLWVMIAFVIVLIVYTASDKGTDDNTRLVFSKIKQVAELQNIMKNPNYHGFDKNNMPYSVIAEEAVQKDSDTVALKGIKADMATKGNKWLALYAGEGELKITAKTLLLTKNVDMFYDGGYEFKSDRAFIEIDKGNAQGDLPVTGQGPMGTLQADSFSVKERGQLIRFDGNVKVVLYRK